MGSRHTKRSQAALRAVGIACMLTMSAVPASAAHLGGFSKVDQKCRDLIAKFFVKTLNTAAKVSSTCHSSRAAGSIPAATNCNDLTVADTKLKLQKAQDKLESAIANACATAGASEAVLEEFTSCPEPCATMTGVPNPMTTDAHLGTCLACVAGDIAGQRGSDMVGSSTPPLSKEEQKCEAAIGKGYGKHLKTVLKMRVKCQKTEDRVGNTTLQPCDTDDSKGKIAKITTVAERILGDACTGVDLTALDSCANTNLADLKACLLAADDLRAGQAFAAAYQLPATICPVALTLTTHAGTGNDWSTTATRLDSGWNGIGHGQDLVDDFKYGFGLSCENAQPPCGTCTVTGFADTPEQPQAFIRCRDNTRIPCSSPFAVDPACASAQTGVVDGTEECAFYLGPPLPLSASNTPMCIVTRAAENATGTVVVETGDISANLSLFAIAHSGISLTQPCPLCIGDPVPQDGQREGVCYGGKNNGESCDVQGFDKTFGDTSLDCVPVATQNVSGQGLRINPAFGTGTQNLPFGTSCDFPLGGLSCACAVCSGAVGVPCNSNDECTGIGTCTSTGGGEARKPNACSDQTCTDIGNGFGECQAGPDVHYCDGQLRANGKGFISCLTNGDCDAVDSACNNNNCGNCTITERRSCFLDPIISSGSADPESPIIASTYCVPPTSSTGINAATGLPGPSRSVVQVETRRSY